MSENLFQFEDFVFDRNAHELRRAGLVVPLQRIPFELLGLLVERRGKVVTRDEIIERVWGKGVFVDSESAINTAVRKLRRALNDDPDKPRLIATLPGRGYRFVAEIGSTDARRAPRPRPIHAMVGRQRQLASLSNGIDSAASGQGRAFLICGEPGIGKTRLVEELTAAADARQMPLLIGHCSEQDEAVAYLPFVEMLETFINNSSSREELRTALGDQAPELVRMTPKLMNILPGLPPTPDLPPAQARRHLFNCFVEFTARFASRRPTLMVLEDLHWADNSTLSLLEHLVERLSELPVFLVGTFRDIDPSLGRNLAKILEGLIRRRLATQIKLKNLRSDHVAEMLKNLSGRSPSESVVKGVHADTEGNPFFVEELFRHLEEEDRLYDSNGQFRPDFEIAERDTPQSVRIVVARRLARLTSSTRDVLAKAAIIGRTFNLAILENSRVADPILKALDEAEVAGLIRSVSAELAPNFEFSHEIIRQAVLAELSTAKRRHLHLEVANSIEHALSSGESLGNLDDRVAELAHHYTVGSNPGKALLYCVRAANKFAGLGSTAETLSHFNNGVALLQQLPNDNNRAELELDLRNAAFAALGDSKGYASPEVEQSISRAVALCRQLGTDWQKTWRALYGMFFVHQLRPNVSGAESVSAELVARAEKHQNIGLVAEAVTWLGYSKMVSGAFVEADQVFDRAWRLLESVPVSAANLTDQQRREWRSTHQMGTPQNNRIISGWNLWFLGYPDRALERVRLATAVAEAPDAPNDIKADIRGFATYIYELRGEQERMRATAEARLGLATEAGFFAGNALSEIYLGWADALAGGLDSGISRMKRNMTELRTAGSECICDRCLIFIATALGRLGRFDQALSAINEALQFIERTGQRYYEPELHRLKGELLLAQDKSNPGRAEQCFNTAIKISRGQQAKSWELRATTSLARLLEKQRKRADARAQLSAIYNWFTEGLDTADLKDAKTLLNELGA